MSTRRQRARRHAPGCDACNDSQVPDTANTSYAGGAANEYGSLHRSGLATVLAAHGLSATPLDGVGDRVPGEIALKTAAPSPRASTDPMDEPVPLARDEHKGMAIARAPARPRPPPYVQCAFEDRLGITNPRRTPPSGARLPRLPSVDCPQSALLSWGDRRSRQLRISLRVGRGSPGATQNRRLPAAHPTDSHAARVMAEIE